MSSNIGHIYSLKMRDLNKVLSFYLYDYYDFPIANEIKMGGGDILREPIKLLNCLRKSNIATKIGFLDIGCNIGQFSLVAAAYGYAVYAFDGDETNILQMSESAKINHFDIQTVCALISDHNDKSSAFRMGGPCGNIFGIPFNQYAVEQAVGEVGCITIDSWWEREGKPGIEIVKMDIEGAEIFALEGMKKLLTEQTPHIYMEYNYAYAPYTDKTFSDYVAWFSDYDYKPFLIGRDNIFYEVTAEDLFNCNECGNYLFIHNGSNLLKEKLIIPYPVRDIRDFALHAIFCTEARYQAGMGIELLRNYELLADTDLPEKFIESLRQYKIQQSNILLTQKEITMIDEIAKRLEKKKDASR